LTPVGNWRSRSWEDGKGNFIRYNDPRVLEYQKAQNKARVIIHNAIKGLVARGYLRTEVETGKDGYWMATRAYITDKGKQAIKQ
jgi:hypothetical protein